MTRASRRIAGAALAIAATAGIGALSWAPYTADPHDHAVIKLSELCSTPRSYWSRAG